MQWQLERGLSATEKLVITYLWSEGAAGMTAVSERVGLTTGGATSLVDRLERDGYVRRRTDQHDRRRMILELTRNGVEARRALDETLDAVAAKLAPADWRPLLDAITEEFDVGAIRLRDGLRARTGELD